MKLKEARTVLILRIVCDSIRKAIKETLKNWKISSKQSLMGFTRDYFFKLVFLITKVMSTYDFKMYKEHTIKRIFGTLDLQFHCLPPGKQP